MARGSVRPPKEDENESAWTLDKGNTGTVLKRLAREHTHAHTHTRTHAQIHTHVVSGVDRPPTERPINEQRERATHGLGESAGRSGERIVIRCPWNRDIAANSIERLYQNQRAPKFGTVQLVSPFFPSTTKKERTPPSWTVNHNEHSHLPAVYHHVSRR